MSRLFVILCMIFCHVIADYNLQGWLASAKQKSYWEQNAPDKMYEHDYITALIMHSFGWTFMIMLPIACVQQFNVGFWFMIMFAFNIFIHAIIDHCKANLKAINLGLDQFIHMIQIVLTSLLLYI